MQLRQQSPRRPLTPNSVSNSQGSRKYAPAINIVNPAKDNNGYLYVSKDSKMLKDILNARSLMSSKTSAVDNSILNQDVFDELPHSSSFSSTTCIEDDKLFLEYSEDSEDEYKSAPLLSSRSHFDLHESNRDILQNFRDIAESEEAEEDLATEPDLHKSSNHILHDFQEVLRSRGESGMESEELELIKDVIKYDERHRYVDKNNLTLFKDILKTQLQDILKHENAVKQALKKLESKQNLREFETTSPRNRIVSSEREPEDAKRFEVDVVFKNVPSLEREILILRALGERLESTLQRTASQRNVFTKAPEIKRDDLLLRTAEIEKFSNFVHIKIIGFIMGLECHALSFIIARGMKHLTAVAQEFCIAQKTLLELKEEANRPFYIPIDPEVPELKRTSFKKLQENPEILIKHIKSKDSSIHFNVLDHDPIYFNNILFNNKKYRDMKMKITLKNEAPEDTNNRHSDEEKPKVLQYSSQKLASGNEIEKRSDKLVKPMIKHKQHHHIRRSITPYNMEKPQMSPKNNLFKTILVGLVQIPCFMLLIMAFTFPDVKC